MDIQGLYRACRRCGSDIQISHVCRCVSDIQISHVCTCVQNTFYTDITHSIVIERILFQRDLYVYLISKYHMYVYVYVMSRYHMYV